MRKSIRAFGFLEEFEVGVAVAAAVDVHAFTVLRLICCGLPAGVQRRGRRPQTGKRSRTVGRASEPATSAFRQDPGKFQIVDARVQDSAPRLREPCPRPRRSESPTPGHQQDPGSFPAGSTNETAVPDHRQTALIAERSCPRSLAKASQQLANIALAVRGMTAVYSFAYQSG
jgi:hypothetical protein